MKKIYFMKKKICTNSLKLAKVTKVFFVILLVDILFFRNFHIKGSGAALKIVLQSKTKQFYEQLLIKFARTGKNR
jgi:hypothetical protein